MTLTEKQTENTSTATQAFTLEMTTANGLTRYYSKEDLIECGIFGSKTSIDRYVAMGKLKKNQIRAFCSLFSGSRGGVYPTMPTKIAIQIRGQYGKKRAKNPP
ncbi:hypothetical protein A4G19_12505 [Pasteurellaceae bacterium Macca]|nr:hypothetical protein [Pasteurellaceae bacterium Macca]